MSIIANSTRCPGLYCGRVLLENGSYTECGACPRGYRANSLSICTKCTDSPVFYDWLYLGFIVITVSVLHCFCIDSTIKRRSFSKGALVLHACALLETLCAAFCTILLVEPFGKLSVSSCQTKQLSDWYTLLHNPNPEYKETLHCTQEAVYPLYTMVFMFYGLAVVLMLILRPWVAAHFVPVLGKMSIYAALYFFPVLSLIQAIYGGLIYFSFPYIVIVISLISNAVHFALKLDQSMGFLVLSTLQNLRNIVIVLGHWLLNAYGIIAITQLTEPLTHCLLILLVPTPAIFYILTARFTDPRKIHVD